MRAQRPLPVEQPPRVSRRSALAGLAALASTACSKLAFVAVNVPAAFGSYVRHANLSFGADPRKTLDVYVPAARSETPLPADLPRQSNGLRPLVVFWYGGRWTTGDKDQYRFVGAALAGLGYVAVLPNYRHFPDVRMAGFMDDAALAAAWAAEHGGEYGADPRRLYLMGHSSGAHMAVLLSLDTRHFAAAGKAVPTIAGTIGLSGPYDFLPLNDADLQDMFGPPARYADSQPIHFARADAPPMLLIHGLKDATVWPKNPINLAAALQAKGATVTLKLYGKLRHADTVAAMSIPARGRAPILGDIAAFVNQPPSS